ncbi:MAG: hypothetical protein MUC31_07845 [Bacteroidales bacterium]|jgi:hypothetical protein|nr:hypothetical protein [Bacteroidales bacterium]
MNKLVRNRDKKIALVLTAAFAWLFIGSLIIFHQEHVLGKHARLNSHLFISPKSKDKQGLTYKLTKPALKLHDNGPGSGILPEGISSAIDRISSELKPRESSSFHHEDIFTYNFPLRAPPVS